jgi:hypothetical protein
MWHASTNVLTTTPEQVFHQALSRFTNVIIYANVVNDATVPFPSAAIELTDPFVQWIERGLEVDADEIGLMSDWHFPVLNKKPKKQWGYHLGSLPPVLRFRWPFNYVGSNNRCHPLRLTPPLRLSSPCSPSCSRSCSSSS